MKASRLRELLGGIPSDTEVIVWDADAEERKIVAIRLSDDSTEAVQLITEEL